MTYYNQSIDNLFTAIADMKDKGECQAFFEDLCTIKELQDMAQRFETALRLKKGENYQNISTAVGVSSATISRVNRCLNYGSGGYEKATQKFLEKAKDSEKDGNK